MVVDAARELKLGIVEKVTLQAKEEQRNEHGQCCQEIETKDY